MGFGALILFGLIVAEVVTLAKVFNQDKRIAQLEEETGKQQKK